MVWSRRTYLGAPPQNVKTWIKRHTTLPYDSEVEYLQSTGAQYIDTGMAPPAQYTGYQVEIAYRYTSKPQNDTWVFGYWNSVPNARSYLIGFYQNYRAEAGPDNSSYWAEIPYDTNFHVARILNDGAYFDGVKLKPTSLTTLGQHGSDGFWLFKSPHTDNGGTRQVKYCKMWTIEGELVRDFVPVKKDGVGYMYDRVSRQLFGNQGTGTFTIGPDKTV